MLLEGKDEQTVCQCDSDLPFRQPLYHSVENNFDSGKNEETA